jgi:hypothetical protein
MANDHRPAVPIALEQVIEGMSELENVLGDAARSVLPAVRARLAEAMAARDRGDPVATMRAIGTAMEQLAALADRLDPEEAAVMRVVARRFGASLLHGDTAEAKRGMDVMFERSGARERKKDG